MDLLAFSALMAAGQMVPGPDWLLVTRHALVGGVRAGMGVASGIACGLAVHATLALGGLTVLVTRQPMWMSVMEWLAAGCLAWVTFGVLREKPVPDGEGGRDGGRLPGSGGLLTGLLCNLFNPKVPLVLTAVSMPFVRLPHGAGWISCLWLVIVVQGWLLWVLWSYCLHGTMARGFHARHGRWLNQLFAVLLCAMAVALVVPG